MYSARVDAYLSIRVVVELDEHVDRSRQRSNHEALIVVRHQTKVKVARGGNEELAEEQDRDQAGVGWVSGNSRHQLSAKHRVSHFDQCKEKHRGHEANPLICRVVKAKRAFWLHKQFVPHSKTAERTG